MFCETVIKIIIILERVFHPRARKMVIVKFEVADRFNEFLINCGFNNSTRLNKLGIKDSFCALLCAFRVEPS